MSGSWHGGKGSKPRPIEISQEEWNNRWDAIFGRDQPKEETKPEPKPEQEKKDEKLPVSGE